jgi:hypothetical protein
MESPMLRVCLSHNFTSAVWTTRPVSLNVRLRGLGTLITTEFLAPRTLHHIEQGEVVQESRLWLSHDCPLSLYFNIRLFLCICATQAICLDKGSSYLVFRSREFENASFAPD